MCYTEHGFDVYVEKYEKLKKRVKPLNMLYTNIQIQFSILYIVFTQQQNIQYIFSQIFTQKCYLTENLIVLVYFYI